MKKLFLSVFLLLAALSSVQAQKMSENTIGLRFGSNDGFGTEITYQRALGTKNRLDVNLGWVGKNYSNVRYNSVQVVGVYQWVWQLEGNFNWYAGAGAGLGHWSTKYHNHPNNWNRNNDNGIYALIAGNIGIEYVFDFPLTLSLDARPEFGLNNNDVRDNFGLNFGLSARYRF